MIFHLVVSFGEFQQVKLILNISQYLVVLAKPELNRGLNTQSSRIVLHEKGILKEVNQILV